MNLATFVGHTIPCNFKRIHYPNLIEFVFLASLDVTYQLQLERAAWRWSTIVTADIPDIDFRRWPHEEYSYHLRKSFVVERVVDDLLIVVAQRPLGEFIASAGISLVRNSDNLPVVATLALDTQQLNDQTPEQVYFIMLHEIAHCLGFGLIWDDLDLVRLGSGVPWFIGENARIFFNALGGDWFTGAIVPIDRDDMGHWRGSVFSDELMSKGWHYPFRKPISAITVAQFADLGYQVNWLAADNYSVPSKTTRGANKAHAEDGHVHRDLFRGEPARAVSEDGRVVR